MGTIHLRDGLWNNMVQSGYNDRNQHIVFKFDWPSILKYMK